MNIKRRSGRYTGWVVLFFFVIMTVFACKKSGPTVALITVIDGTTKAAIPGATVTLWQDTSVNNVNGVQSTIRVSKITDGSGRAQFEFELEAFLNITVVNGQDSGRSYVRLVEHETESVTVNL